MRFPLSAQDILEGASTCHCIGLFIIMTQLVRHFHMYYAKYCEIQFIFIPVYTEISQFAVEFCCIRTLASVKLT